MDLHRSKITSRRVDDRSLGAAKRMRAVILTAKTDRSNPFVDQAGILPCAHVAERSILLGRYSCRSSRHTTRAMQASSLEHRPSVRIERDVPSFAAIQSHAFECPDRRPRLPMSAFRWQGSISPTVPPSGANLIVPCGFVLLWRLGRRLDERESQASRDPGR